MLRSPPSRRRGLKIKFSLNIHNITTVASFAEAWIENFVYHIFKLICVSPPSRRRGLKTYDGCHFSCGVIVASFAEAWIEKLGKNIVTGIIKVASFAEAWIEKHPSFGVKYSPASPPSRRRGLKKALLKILAVLQRRLLRGGVD